MRGQEAKAFLARSRPTQATLNASGRDHCLNRDHTETLCRALEVQLEPIKMEYYSVCTLIRLDEQDCYKSVLEASPELISQSALWELQSCSNTAGYLAVRKEFFASSLVFITPWIRLHCHQIHGPSSTAHCQQWRTSPQARRSGEAPRLARTQPNTYRPFPPQPHKNTLKSLIILHSPPTGGLQQRLP